MIVQCEQCQTRFKIPDEKVTDKGVKVRCTKCQATFRVFRPTAAGAPLPLGGASEADPFALFGSPGAPKNDGATRPYPQLNRPPLAPSYEAQRELPKAAFDAVTNIGPRPLAGPVRPPPPAQPAPPADPFGMLGVAPAAPADQVAVSGPAPAALEDPFAMLGLAPAPAAAPAPPNPDPFAMLGLPPEPPAPLNRADAFAMLAAPPSPLPADPFAMLGAPAPARADPFATVKTAAPAPDDDPFAMLGPPAPAPQADPFATVKTAAPAPDDDPFAMLGPGPAAPPAGAVDFSGAVTAVGRPPNDPSAENTQVAAPQSPPQAPAESLLSEVPAPGADPFAGVPMDNLDVEVGSPGGLPSTDARAELFQMPPASAAAPAPVESPLAMVADAPPVAPSGPRPARPAPTAATEAEAGPVARGPGAFRRVGGVVVNVAVAAALTFVFVAVGTAYLTDGELDRTAFSLERLQAIVASPKAMVARDVSTGLYETRSGRAVFFVRGQVENRGAGRGKGKVRAALVEGESLVRAVEGYAGTIATPEDLYSIADAADVEALNSKSGQSAVELMPGGVAEFLLAFYDYPPDLGGFRVKVTVVEEAAKETATR